MESIDVKDLQKATITQGGTPVPAVVWWYCIEYEPEDTPLNADLCNRLLNNELKGFIEKYPQYIYQTKMTEEDIKLFKREIKEN